MWCILGHKYIKDNHRETVSHYRKHFHELNQGDIQFPMKTKDVPTLERINRLNKNVFELSSNDETFHLNT